MIDRETEEQLALDEIQGDILVGLQKQAEMFVGFVIEDVARFKRFLSGLHLTSTRDSLLAQARIDAFRANGGNGMLDIRGVNIGFTLDGLRKLAGDAVLDIADPAFRDGLAARSALLNDPTAGDGAPASWRIGNGIGSLDGLLLVTARGETELRATMDDIDRAAGGPATWITFFGEIGAVRPGANGGHEHFGYEDGISQPSVRGRIDGGSASPVFLSPGRNPDDPNQGLPGSDLHWPGEFVFGYSEQDRTDVEHPLPPKRGDLPWMTNGSFMVFRRLEQKVPEFHAAMTAAAAAAGMSPLVLEARLVGRFRSGAPVSLVATGADDPVLGADLLRNNDFEFGGDDPDGAKCPYAAHIRKAYPRNDLTPAADGATGAAGETTSEADTQTHRILRRGIPFGPEVSGAEAAAGHTTLSRGLMFVCYQTSIEDQFEFITRNWVNNDRFARAGTGLDPLLGRAHGATASRTVNAGSFPPAGPPNPVALIQDFIVPTGGGYFFMPSLSAVRTVLGA